MSRVAVAADFAVPKKIGRPKKKLDLPEGWQQEVLERYAQGESDVGIRAYFIESGYGYISEDLWYRWLKEEPEFSKTIEEGHTLERRWWETTGRLLALKGGGNGQVWGLNMRNRFGFRDEAKVEVLVNPLDAITNAVNQQGILGHVIDQQDQPLLPRGTTYEHGE